MDFQEIKKLSSGDLHKHLTELRQKVRELRFSIANNQLKNMHEFRQTKLAIARILTVLKQQEKTTVKAVETKNSQEDHKE
jgi:ribosomal protein L29